MNLSKSRYTLYRQCPKALWLSVKKPDAAPEVDNSRFEAGQQVGELAKKWLGSSVDATMKKPDGSLDLQGMIQRTKELMADESVQNICEAAFLADGCYCAVDILHREKDGWIIYEVKSSSMRDEEGHVDEKEDDINDVYIWDISYQKYVLTLCDKRVYGTYLVCLNKDYVLQGALDIKQLFVSKDVSNLVNAEYPLVEGNCKKAKSVLNEKNEPQQKLHAGCNKPYECAFKQYCMKPLDIPEYSVFNMYRMWWTKKIEYFYDGFCTLGQLQKVPKLNEHHKLQIACGLNGTDYIDKEAIRAWIKDNITYPLYHLDFETVQYAIPQYQGTHPYQQIPFQYSLHIERKAKDPDIEHREFLADANSANPMRDLAEQLCKDIPADKCVLVFNDAFEKTRLREMAEAFPDLHDHLMAICDNIVDLLVPFRNWNYYRPAMNGSFSIKKVLPALFPNDPKLDYHNLPGKVHNGGEAMDMFPKMRDMDGQKLADARESLLRYCELDTWSMVVILRKLYQVSK